MLFARSVKRAVCAILIGGLLFAQAAFAMRPCDSDMSAATAITSGQQHDCCEQSVKEVSLCVAKCIDGSKVTGPEPLKMFAAYVAVVLPLPVFDANRQASHRARPDLVADPPSIVRFCRFLI